MTRRLLLAATLLAIAALPSSEAYRARGVVVAEVSDGDVHRFVDAMRRLSAGDSSCAALEDYFRDASRGLRAYDSKLGMNRRQLCSAIRRSPARYSAIEAKLGGLDSAVARVDSIFARFHALYPEGRQPGVYFVV